jgi:hypothetical protein
MTVYVMLVAVSTLFIQTATAASALANVKVFFAGGPVLLTPFQNAKVCATNADNTDSPVVIAVIDWGDSTILTAKELTLKPGEGACLNFAQKSSLTNGSSEASQNVIGVLVPFGHLDGKGGITQPVNHGPIPCTVRSVQIQLAQPNGGSGQTFLYVAMEEFH